MKKSYIVVACIGIALLVLPSSFNYLLTLRTIAFADRFVETLAAGKVREAYAMTSSEYQKGIDARQFRRTVRGLKLSGFKSVEWQPTFSSGKVSLTGEVKTADQKLVPLLLQAIKENGEWKIGSIQGPPAEPVRYRTSRGLFGPIREEPEILADKPDDAEIKRLVTASILSLAQAIKTEDFDSFHREVASPWRDQTSTGVMRRVFRRFEERDVDLSVVKDLRLVFHQPPELQDRGPSRLLKVRGKFIGPRDVVEFDMTYWPEKTGWKLIGIWLGVRDPFLDEEEEDETTAD